MSEITTVLETLVTEVEAGRPAALCIVVKTHGSTPRAPGAAMLVSADRSTVGTVGGGSVEAEVRRRAFELLQQDASGLLDFGLDQDDGDVDGLICGGRMQVAAMSVGGAASLEPFQAALALAVRREPASFPVIVEHAGQRREYRLHIEPPPTLVIAGAGHVGQALAELAVKLDFHVVVIDDRADVASPARFNERVELIVADIVESLRQYPIDGGCYVVIATRGHLRDQQALDAVIRRPYAYVGMIGSKLKSATVLKALAKAGISRNLLDQVHTPIGLPIDALTVNEIAVSILAELIQTRRRTTPKVIEGPFEVTA